jgi:ATP-dependent Clp protease ATP-binding subunit ClpA
LEFRQAYIEPIHILHALLRQEQGVAPQVILRAGGDTSQIGLSRQSSEVLSAAEREAAGLKDEYISVEHILLGLAKAGGDPAFGARPLKRAIQRELQDGLAMKILQGEIHAGETVRVGRGREGLTFTPEWKRAGGEDPGEPPTD